MFFLKLLRILLTALRFQLIHHTNYHRLQEADQVGENARLKGFHSVDDDEEKVSSWSAYTLYTISSRLFLCLPLLRSSSCAHLLSLAVCSYPLTTFLCLLPPSTHLPAPFLSPPNPQDATVVGADFIRLHLHMTVNDDVAEKEFEVRGGGGRDG